MPELPDFESEQEDEGLNCPVCNRTKNFVLDTRRKDGMTRRLRQCQECGKRFATLEAHEEVIDQANEIRKRFVDLQLALDIRLPGDLIG